MHASINKTNFMAFLLLIFLGLGFMSTLYYIQHKSQFHQHVYSTAEIIRTRALSHRLHLAEYRNAHLESEIAELNLKAAGGSYYDAAQYFQLQQLARFIGLEEQSGPGVAITIKDSNKPLLLGDNPNKGIVHNTDLVEVVNDLRAAGARAVAINHQPIMSLTGISCSGPIITINGTRVTSPFTVDALGDSNHLMNAMHQQQSFFKLLQKYDIQVDAAPKNVIIPAYSSTEASS